MNLVIIQARMGSQRLPGKVLADVCGQPMLQRVVDRASKANLVDRIVVATTDSPNDDPIVRFCRQREIECFRGSENDVLDRYFQAASFYRANHVVRVTSDCPLIDPQNLDQVVGKLGAVKENCEYACNFYPVRTYPRGMDAEAVNFSTLAQMWRWAQQPRHREHVTLAIYENPDRFRIASVRNQSDYSHLRWTVDTDQDISLVRQIYEYFGKTSFSWTDVVKAYENNRQWASINQTVQQKAA